jgi:hypothetical protein
MPVLLRFIRTVGVTALFSVASFAARAEPYPAKQMTIFVPYAAECPQGSAVSAAFDKLGAVPVGSSPQDFEAFMRGGRQMGPDPQAGQRQDRVMSGSNSDRTRFSVIGSRGEHRN